MKAKIVLFFISFHVLSNVMYAKPMPAGGPVVTKVACTEYQAAWLYSDGKVRSFIWNAKTGHVEFTPFDIGARTAVDVSTGFNRITILDDQGYVWLNNGGANTAVRWDKDATGAAFNGNVSIYGYFYTYMSIRSDGTIWYWGGDDYKFYGGTGVALPTKLNQPAGVKFVKLATGNVILGLTSTGDVYQWSKGSTNYVKVNLPRPASDVAASHNDYFVAVVPDNISASTMGYPYCWGSESKFWGGDGSSYSSSAPVSVKTLWKMSSPIKKITANHNVIHYIDANGDLYGVGDNPNGEIGNGQEIVNHKEKYATPYAWSWAKYELLTGGPVHVSAGIKFKDIFTGNSFAFYHYALDVSDSLYFWGRNKSFVGGDGAVNNQEATYPNALDVLTPSRRTPMGVAPTQTIGYDFKMYTLKGIPKQTVILPLAALSAIATPTSLTAGGRPNYGYSITKVQWTKVSGPASYSITLPNSLITTVTGLTGGTYVFAVQTTDNNTGTITAYDTVVVNTSPVIITNPPEVNAGSDQAISLPTSIATLLGSALVTSGSISSYKWTQTSGPSTAVFANAAAAQTNVSGLIQGTYIFQLTATDNSGQQSSDALTVTVKAAPVTSTFTVSAGPDLTIGLPISSVTIAGAATVKGETVSSCRWTQVSGPSTATIAGGGSITPTVSKLVQGSYVFQVVLVSQSGKSSNDQVKVTVNAAPTGTFTVSAGPDVTIRLPTTSVKIAGAATVKGETVNTCRWTQVSGPSTATIAGGGSIAPTVSKLVQGSYVFQVALTSLSGISTSDQVKVTVNAAVSSAYVDSAAASSATVLATTGTIGSLKLYPNPVAPDQQLTVEGSTGIDGTVRFTIYDISGRQVKQVVSENLLSSFRQTLSLTGLPRGVYMLTVVSGGKEKPTVLRFVIM